MYSVRENRTSILRASRGPLPHALEHVSRLGGGTTLCLSGGQAHSSCPEGRDRIGLGSQPDPEITKTSARSFSRSTSSTELRYQSSAIEQNAVLEAHFAAELANRDLVIGELESMLLGSNQLQSKLLQSEKRASRQELLLASQDVTINELQSKLSEMRLAQKAKDTCCNEMLSSLEKAYTKVHQSTVKAEGALAIIKEHKDQRAQAEDELQEHLQGQQHLMSLRDGRIQGLEENLKLTEETVVCLQKQLKDTTVQMEVQAQAEFMMQQELKRMLEDLKHHQSTIAELRNQHEADCTKIEELQQSAEAEAQLRQDVSDLKEQLQSSHDLLKKYQEKEQSEHHLRGALAKKDMLLSEVAQELARRDGQVKYFCETLKEEQMKGLSQGHSLKLVLEQSERFSLVRSDLEHRNAALEKEVIRLKHEVRKYAEIIVGNEGEPFYEVRHPKSPSIDTAELSISQDAAFEPVQTRLPVGQESDPRHTGDRALRQLMQQP